jgi:hypothetical protein
MGWHKNTRNLLTTSSLVARVPTVTCKVQANMSLGLIKHRNMKSVWEWSGGTVLRILNLGVRWR